MTGQPVETANQPYPPDWEKVAELRVFNSTPKEWTKLISWRAEMKRKGWKLLKVTTGPSRMIAIFGRTRQELLNR